MLAEPNLRNDENVLYKARVKIIESPSQSVGIKGRGTLCLTNQRMLWLPENSTQVDILYNSIKEGTVIYEFMLTL